MLNIYIERQTETCRQMLLIDEENREKVRQKERCTERKKGKSKRKRDANELGTKRK